MVLYLYLCSTYILSLKKFLILFKTIFTVDMWYLKSHFCCYSQFHIIMWHFYFHFHNKLNTNAFHFTFNINVHMSSTSILFNFCHKKLVIIVLKRSQLTLMVSPKKRETIRSLAKIQDFNFMWMNSHLVNPMWVIVVLILHGWIYRKMRLVVKDDFSVKIVIFFQTLQSPVSEETTLDMVIPLSS